MSWDEKRLDQLGYVGRGKSRHRPRNASFLYGGKHPFIQTGDINEANLYINHFTQTYSDAGLAQSKLWDEGTLVISIVGANTAETAILGIKACFPDSVIGFIANERVADCKYIKYYFDTIKIEMKRISEGTARENLSMQKLLSFKIPTPPLPTQRRIAIILSAYDDLIENNFKRIRLLEEAAQNIYREWFVHFRFPGHERAEFGEDGVPVGWEMKKLEGVLQLNYGKSLRKDDRNESGKYPVYGSSGIVGYHDEYLVEGIGIILGRKGNVGATFLSFKNFFPIDTVYFVTGNISIWYTYLYLSNETFVSSDVAVPGLNRNYAYSKDMLVPSPEIMELFDQQVKPMYYQIDLLEDYNSRLKEARDILLPRLMNRTIEV